ncbi:MAG: IS30 family transposase [Sulfurimonadaceae bacterium]
MSALVNAGCLQKEIAKKVDVSPSTINRELRRNHLVRDQCYTAEQAQIFTVVRHKHKHKKVVLTKSVERYIRKHLKQDWSPEQISGRMKLDIGISIVHETIYRYIYADKANGRRLYKSLRHKNKKYHKRSNTYKTRGTIKDRVMIDKRPRIVETKSRIVTLRSIQ